MQQLQRSDSQRGNDLTRAMAVLQLVARSKVFASDVDEDPGHEFTKIVSIRYSLLCSRHRDHRWGFSARDVVSAASQLKRGGLAACSATDPLNTNFLCLSTDS